MQFHTLLFSMIALHITEKGCVSFGIFTLYFTFNFLMYQQKIHELCRVKFIYRISHSDRSLQAHVWINTKISAALYAYIVGQDARERRRKKTKFLCIREVSNTFHTIAGVGNDKIVTRFSELTTVLEKGKKIE